MKKSTVKNPSRGTKAPVDDKEQSRRFKEEARKIGASTGVDIEFNKALDVILRKPVKPDQIQGERISRKKPE